MIDLTSYIQQGANNLIEAAKTAYSKQGRGALFMRPQLDQGNGRTSVIYMPLSILIEDQDKSINLVKLYQPNQEAILILALDKPQSIYTYIINFNGNIYLQDLDI